MTDHVITAEQLHRLGIHGQRLQEQLRCKKLYRVLGDIYCNRFPTTLDKCRAVVMWRADAVLSHFTAAWIYGWCSEPEVVEAYVSSEPSEPVPSWLHLHVAPYETYAADRVVL